MSDIWARDIMTVDPVTVTPETSVVEAAELMVERGVGALPVMLHGNLVGIVTESDLIMQDVKLQYPTYIQLLGGIIQYPPATARFESELKKAVAAAVGDVMTSDPVTVQEFATVEDVATLLAEEDVSHLPVLEGADLVGIISKSDVVRSLVREADVSAADDSSGTQADASADGES